MTPYEKKVTETLSSCLQQAQAIGLALEGHELTSEEKWALEPYRVLLMTIVADSCRQPTPSLYDSGREDLYASSATHRGNT